MIVVLTWDNPIMACGIDTVKTLAQVINRGLNPGVTEVIPPTVPQCSPDEQVPAASSRS